MTLFSYPSSTVITRDYCTSEKKTTPKHQDFLKFTCLLHCSFTRLSYLPVCYTAPLPVYLIYLSITLFLCEFILFTCLLHCSFARLSYLPVCYIVPLPVYLIYMSVTLILCQFISFTCLLHCSFASLSVMATSGVDDSLSRSSNKWRAFSTISSRVSFSCSHWWSKIRESPRGRQPYK